MQPTLHLLVHQVVDVLRRWKWLGKLQKQSFPTTHEDTHCIPPSWMLKQAKYGQVWPQQGQVGLKKARVQPASPAKLRVPDPDNFPPPQAGSD